MYEETGNAEQNDWYARRHELLCGDVFTTHDGRLVQLDRTVPGDGTRWYVANWSEYTKGWGFEDDTIEPGDLLARANDPAKAVRQ